MPAQRSNEDQAVRISKSIFVTNFPDNLGSKELWKVCEGYRKVIDVFIPNHRSKAGLACRFHLHAMLPVLTCKQPVKTMRPSNPMRMATFGSFVSVLEGHSPLIASVAPHGAKELFTWNLSFLEPMESVYTSDDESKHGARILNDGAQNSDVESDDECNVDGVSETVFNGPTNGEDMVDMPRVDAKVMDHSQEVHDSFNGESVSSFSYKVHNGGSILDILDDMVRVGHSMGYNLDGCLKDMERIIGSQGDEDVLK
ncbi:RNA-directed DNA polymerase, eukaryota [Tanacetum coccineum]